MLLLTISVYVDRNQTLGGPLGNAKCLDLDARQNPPSSPSPLYHSFSSSSWQSDMRLRRQNINTFTTRRNSLKPPILNSLLNC